MTTIWNKRRTKLVTITNNAGNGWIAQYIQPCPGEEGQVLATKHYVTEARCMRWALKLLTA